MATHKIIIEVLVSSEHTENALWNEWRGRLEEKCPNWDVENIIVEKI